MNRIGRMLSKLNGICFNRLRNHISPTWTPSRLVVTKFDPSMGDLMELSNSGVVVVQFTAKWCAPCQAVAPQFSSLSDKYPKISFYYVDVDENSSVSKNLNIKTLPTFLVLNKGKIEERTEGSAIVVLKEAIDKSIPLSETLNHEK